MPTAPGGSIGMEKQSSCSSPLQRLSPQDVLVPNAAPVPASRTRPLMPTAAGRSIGVEPKKQPSSSPLQRPSPQHVLVPNAAPVPASRTTSLMPTATGSATKPWAPLYAQPGDANGRPYTSAGLSPANAYQSASCGPLAGNPDRSNLLKAVQRARSPGELEDIANRLTSGHHHGGVQEVAEPCAWEMAMKELVRRLAMLDLRPDVFQRLLRGLVDPAVAGVSNRQAAWGSVAEPRAQDLRIALQVARTPGDLEGLVSSLTWNNDNAGVPLMPITKTGDGEESLKELVAHLAALNLQEVLERLFRCLVYSWDIEQSNGPELLHHFFSTLDHSHCSIFINELAIPRFWDMVTSKVGYMTMIVLLEYAGHSAILQTHMSNYTVQIARNANGSQFLQTFLERGCNNEIREGIISCVEANLVELSMDQYGSLLVQSCFAPSIKKPSILRHGLRGFLRLPDEVLRELTENHYSSYILLWLLHTSQYINIISAVTLPEAIQLAERLLGVGATCELNSIARLVLEESMISSAQSGWH